MRTLTNRNKLYLIGILIFLLQISCNRTDMNHISVKNDVVKKQVIQLNFIGHWYSEGIRKNFVEEIVREFEFVNQDINVNLKYPEELYNNENSKEVKLILEQIQKPVADWDIMRVKEHYGNIANILNDPEWGKKYLVDFSTIPGFFESHKPVINTKIYRERNGGVVVGPYIEGFFYAIYVNLDVAKKVGISVKQYGMTFDDLLAYSKAVYDYNKANKTHIATIFEDFRWISTETLFKNLYYSELSGYDEIIDTKLTQNKLKAIEKTYTALEELSKYEPIIKSRKNIVWGINNDYPLKDSCLFFINGSWMYNIWTKKNKTDILKMLPCELPVFKEYDSYLYGYSSNWIIPKNAPHKDAAIKLMMYWCRPEISEKWVNYTKCPTGVKGNISNAELGVDPFESFLYAIDTKYQNKKINPNENKYVYGENNLKINFQVIEVLEGKITAKQAISNFKSKASFK
jgi:ABC-type glycerol-3-phosphate transport system substrate-binding protein